MAIDTTSPIAVLGLGTMGHGIAQTFAIAGYTVHGYDHDPQARHTLKERVRSNLTAFVEAELIRPSEIEPALARLIVHDREVDAVREARFITEAVQEDLLVKQELFARIESLVADDAILASNSSAFPISQSGSKLKRPERAVVTHWFNPPHLVPLVEVVPSPATADSVVESTVDLLTRIGKHALRLNKELPGFLVNRVQVAIQREVWNLLQEGVASPADIDAALSASVGFRMAAVGPLEVYDFGGLDIQATTFRNLVPSIASGVEVPSRVQSLVDQGHLGAKTGQGFYDYPGDRIRERRQRRDALFLQLAKLLYRK
ncbi:MAG: 3-hydroxybutyryl-CoA dehydrogenase [Planctomycetota bacterium]